MLYLFQGLIYKGTIHGPAGPIFTGQSKEASKSARRLNGRLYELVVFEGIMEEEDAKDLLDRRDLLAVWVVSDILINPKLEEDYLD